MSWRSARLVSRPLSDHTRTRLSAVRGFLSYAPWAPLAFATAYLVWLVARLPSIVDAIQLTPDATWAPVLAEDLNLGTEGGLIYVSEATHLSTILFLIATRSVPFHRVLWDWAPFLVSLAGLGLTAWACWRVAGRWAALLSLSIGVAATAPVLLTVVPEGMHGFTFFSDAVLAAFLVFCATTWKTSAPALRVTATVLVVLLSALTVASDPLFLITGLLPFWITGVLLSFTHNSKRNRGFAVLVTIITGSTLVLAVTISRLMYAYGFRKTYANNGYTAASIEQIRRNVLLFRNLLLAQGNSIYSGGIPEGTRARAMALMAVFLAAAVIGAVVVYFRIVLRRWEPKWANEMSTLYVLYFTLSALAMFGAFSLSSFAAGPTEPSRYIVSVFYSLAAVAPVLCCRRVGWRAAGSVGVALFCALSLVGRNGVYTYKDYYFLRSFDVNGADVVSYLVNEGVTRGYSGYLTSHPVTYLSGGRVRIFPIIACRQPVSTALCPFSVNTRTAWYRPESGVRSVILFDAAGPPSITPPPPPELGAPVRVGRFGNLYLFVYDYDVASKFEAGCPVGSASFTCPPQPQ